MKYIIILLLLVGCGHKPNITEVKYPQSNLRIWSECTIHFDPIDSTKPANANGPIDEDYFVPFSIDHSGMITEYYLLYATYYGSTIKMKRDSSIIIEGDTVKAIRGLAIQFLNQSTTHTTGMSLPSGYGLNGGPITYSGTLNIPEYTRAWWKEVKKDSILTITY